MSENELEQKYEHLKNIIKSYGKVAIAYSAGVDSTFLLKVAKLTLGENVLAITAVSEFVPKKEVKEACDFCEQEQVQQVILNVHPLAKEKIVKNPPVRCYYCKQLIFTEMIACAKEKGIVVLCEGSNVDDESDYRPGMKAVRELGVHSPLKEAGLTKEEIRILSKRLELRTWKKPSFACLASRFVYGEDLSLQKLNRVEQGEEFLFSLGIRQARIRVHSTMARIELLPEEMHLVMQDGVRLCVVEKLKELGFDYVTLDLQGYRTGSMNEIL